MPVNIRKPFSVGVASLFALVGALLVLSAPALAATPETPETGKASAVSTTTTTLEGGVLNPHAKGEVGEYEYRFRISETECEGESSTAPEAAAGNEKEKVPPVDLTNLQPNAHYTVCLIEHNLGGEYSLPSTPIHFTTKSSPPEIKSESASNVKATEATLEGVVNPNNQVTECHFQYGLETGSVTEHEVPCLPELLKGFGEQHVTTSKLNEQGQPVSGALTGLEAGQGYHFRIIAKNGKGEETAGPVQEFKKLVAPPEKPETTAAEALANTTATLHGVVNPAGSSSVSWFFQYAAGSSCTATGASTTSLRGPEEVQADTAEAALTGLQPGTQYTACLVAENEAKERTAGNEVSFNTTGTLPAITEQAVVSVSGTEATLSAKIDPEGSPTTYKVQYGTSNASEASTPEANLPGSTTPTAVEVRLTGLKPDTTYTYNFIATNTVGQDESTPQQLTTPATLTTGGSGASCPNRTLSGFDPNLPDCRAYELVTTEGNQDVDAPPEEADLGKSFVREADNATPYPVRAAVDGNAVAFVADPPTGEQGEGSGAQGPGLGNQWLATRGVNGWRPRDVSPPAGKILGLRYEAFSPDLGSGVLALAKSTSVPAEPATPGNCAGLDLRTNADNTYHALLTATTTEGQCGYPVFAGENAGSSAVSAGAHRIFQTEAALLPGNIAQTGAVEEACDAACNLYDSVSGTMHLVNQLPNGRTPRATFGSSELQGPELETRGPNTRGPDFSGAISTDGSRIFWTDQESPATIYVRENDTTTVRVSSGEHPATFWTATADGRFAYYTEGGALWRYDLQSQTREEIAGAAAAVQGVVGINTEGEDGAYLYFVADGALTGGATPQHCDQRPELRTPAYTEYLEEEQGTRPYTRGCNLYLRHDGAIDFVATLAPEDNQLHRYAQETPEAGDWQPGLGFRTAEVTPDGRHLAFASSRPLTGYDNVVPLEAEEVYRRVPEMFVYDAASGSIGCASCNPAGVTPVIPTEPGGNPGSYIGGVAVPISYQPTYMRRWITDDGSEAFFDTSQSLLPSDKNGFNQDVYEWEREGALGCPTAAQARSGRGCTFLLSGGTGSDNSFFIDASSTGGDVFIDTREPLVVQDRDERTDVYDVRSDGGFPQASLACVGTGCQGLPAAPPTFATPASTTFDGPGNFPASVPKKGETAAQLRAKRLKRALAQCRRKHIARRRIVCEKLAHEKYDPVGRPAKRGRS